MAGTFGTLYLNSGTGAYRYVPQDSSFEGATSVTDAFTMSVSDGGASASQTLTVNVGGVNDTPGLAAITGLSFSDTASDDSFSAHSIPVGDRSRQWGHADICHHWWKCRYQPVWLYSLQAAPTVRFM